MLRLALRGFRFHEINATTWSPKAHPEWWAGRTDRLPYDGFRSQLHAEPFVALAKQTGRWVAWCDPVWSAMGNPQPEVTQGEQLIRNLITAYPQTVIPVYSTNLGGPATAPPACYPYLWPVMQGPYRGWGLSGQAYGVDPAVVAQWARRALHDGALLHLEPISAWFWFPPLAFTSAADAAYTIDPAWSGRGTPLPAFATLTAALLS